MTNNPPRILVVDDTPENIKVLGSALTQNNYDLTLASSGEAAMQMVEEILPDLILLDVMMPGINGFEVCEFVKNNPRTQDIEIIFITAAITQADELKGLALGAVDYIHKPFSIPIIQAKVALHLERIANKKLRDDIEQITRHDLKTPLNAIMGYPQLMLFDETLSDENRGYLQEILRAGQQMQHLINHSLDLFKMEKGLYQYQPLPLNIEAAIAQVIGDLRTFAQERKVSIDTQSRNDKTPLMVLAETSLTYSLFANLIRNAIEACKADDNIVILIEGENDKAIVSITNPGSVPESIRGTFFEKYVTAGKFGGTGLGTYSAKLMATTQQGTIAMNTNAHETCITVQLPID